VVTATPRRERLAVLARPRVGVPRDRPRPPPERRDRRENLRVRRIPDGM